MDTEKIFVGFLKLVYMYFREEKNIAFYAERLGIAANWLNEIIEDFSDKSFSSPILGDSSSILAGSVRFLIQSAALHGNFATLK